jgi:predicted amidohydrolase YtcJ
MKKELHPALINSVGILALLLAPVVAAAAAQTAASADSAGQADMILYNGVVRTMDTAKPVADAVAVRGSRIARVGSNSDVLSLKGPRTRMIDLQRKLLLPGFNDAHTHFGNAVDWFFQVRLMDVNDEPGMLKRLREAVARVPKGIWITGGDWSARAAWAHGKQAGAFVTFKPSLPAVDAISPEHPVLFRRYDGVYFANSRALRLARLAKESPDPAGGQYERDPVTGEFTGILFGTAGEHIARIVPPMSHAQKLIGARGVFRELNSYGITSIQDIARVDEISQKKIFPTDVERSHSDLSLFLDLKKTGELTARVYAILPLAVWRDVWDYGIRPGGGDEMVRYGGLKFEADDGLMAAPFANHPGYFGQWSYRLVDEQTLERNIVDADKAGFDMCIHVMGDKASHLVLDWFQEAIEKNGPRDRRLRLIHLWYTTLSDIQRAGRMGVTADITPYHLLRDVKAVERLLGPERAGASHAWRSMEESGLNVDLVSDFPGTFDRTFISPVKPLENIYYAISRSNPAEGTPAPWHPEQRLRMEQALRAYTVNPAFASREEHLKGTITEGKLADLVVLSRNIVTATPEEVLSTEVRYTILGGKIVFRGASQ